jgi:hypothetical protein
MRFFNNPDQRTVDLRAKYRAEYGNDWWKDEDIKAEYRAERREIYRNGPPSDPTGKRSSGKKRKKSRKSVISDRQVDAIVESGDLSDENVELLADWVVNEFKQLDEDDFQEQLSHFARHPTGKTKKQLSATKAKKITQKALEELGIEIGRWTSMYGGQGFGAKVKNATLDGQKVKIVITMHADYWDVAFTEDKTNPKGLLSEVGGVYHFYAQKELGDLVKLMATYYLGAEEDVRDIIDRLGAEDEDDAIAMLQIQKLPKKVQKAFFKIQGKLEELPDSYFNDGLFYDHVLITDGIALHIDTKNGSKKPQDLLQVLFLNSGTIQILAVKTDVTKQYKLSSTTAAFNYIKKWIESNL